MANHHKDADLDGVLVQVCEIVSAIAEGRDLPGGMSPVRSMNHLRDRVAPHAMTSARAAALAESLNRLYGAIRDETEPIAPLANLILHECETGSMQ